MEFSVGFDQLRLPGSDKAIVVNRRNFWQVALFDSQSDLLDAGFGQLQLIPRDLHRLTESDPVPIGIGCIAGEKDLLSPDHRLNRLRVQVGLEKLRAAFVDLPILKQRQSEADGILSIAVRLSFLVPSRKVTASELVAAVEVAARIIEWLT